MSVPGAGATILRVLQHRYEELRGPDHGLTFKMFSTSDFRDGVLNHVTLFLYRVEVDPTRRHVETTAISPERRRTSLAVELRYLLTVWGSNAAKEQEILGDCLAILDDAAFIGTDQLDPTYPWEPGTSLKVSIDPLPTEQLLRLWDAMQPAYRLSVPYLVRTVRLAPREQVAGRLIEERQNVYLPRGTTP